MWSRSFGIFSAMFTVTLPLNEFGRIIGLEFENVTTPKTE
jgi:hypothetical protein